MRLYIDLEYGLLGRFSRIPSMLQDLRFAFRFFAKSPGFALVAVLTLAVGISATTAIFSVAYGVLMRPLPFSRSQRIMAIFEVTSTGARSRVADPNFDDFRDLNHSFQALAKYNEDVVSVSGASLATRTSVAGVSPGFLKVFGVQPLMGREFDADDSKKGASPTALVSYGYWRDFLGSSRDLSQTRLKVDGKVFSVVGVLPEGFHFPSKVDLWLPADLDGENPSRTSHNYSVVGRLRDGVSVEQANADIGAIARHIFGASGDRGDYILRDGLVIPLRDSIAGSARPALLVLQGAVGFLLLVACANVANLLLAQASAREEELAVRIALGASRGRLLRQFLVEAFILSLTGGGLGILGAYWEVAGLLALAPHDLPRLESISLSIPALLFALMLSTAVAVGLGAFTATRATSGDQRRGAAVGTRGVMGSRRGHRAGRMIVAAQIAITVVLVVGAGLLGRSLMKVLRVDPGFRVDNIVTMDLSLPWARDQKDKISQAAFYSELIGRLARLPGVRTVGATSGLPLDGGLPDGMFLLATQKEIPKTAEGLGELFQQKGRLGAADFCVATDGYFEALGIPLVRGRLFDSRDGEDTPHVAMISESLARARWPQQDPIGKTIEFGNMDGDFRVLTVIGIVGDTHEYGLDSPPRPTVYVDLFQRPASSVTLTLRVDADPQSVASSARVILRSIGPEIPATFRAFSEVYSASLGSRSFTVMLVGFFGATALLLATIGVFGAMAYSVNRRFREMGVRMALGASSGDITKLILGQGLRTALLGAAVGVAGALALTRTIESLLFGVTSTDPLTFAAGTLLIVGSALLACYLPARRATQVDPMVALRCE